MPEHTMKTKMKKSKSSRGTRATRKPDPATIAILNRLEELEIWQKRILPAAREQGIRLNRTEGMLDELKATDLGMRSDFESAEARDGASFLSIAERLASLEKQTRKLFGRMSKRDECASRFRKEFNEAMARIAMLEDAQRPASPAKQARACVVQQLLDLIVEGRKA